MKATIVLSVGLISCSVATGSSWAQDDKAKGGLSSSYGQAAEAVGEAKAEKDKQRREKLLKQRDEIVKASVTLLESIPKQRAASRNIGTSHAPSPSTLEEDAYDAEEVDKAIKVSVRLLGGYKGTVRMYGSSLKGFWKTYTPPLLKRGSFAGGELSKQRVDAIFESVVALLEATEALED